MLSLESIFPSSYLIKNNPPLFKRWVPTGVGMFLLVLLFIPGALLGGVYSGNVTEMSSGMGILSEHVLYANFATAVGMMVMGVFVFPFIYRFHFFDLLVGGFSLLILLSGICACSESVAVIVLCSFLLGAVRVATMVIIIFTLAEGVLGVNIASVLSPPDDTPKTTLDKVNTLRGVAINAIYLLMLSIGQMGSYLTSYIAYHFRWQYTYWVMMAIAMIGLVVLLIILNPNCERKRSKPALPPLNATIPSALFFLALT